MFYDVKIINARGVVKKVVPASELSKQYREKFKIKLNIPNAKNIGRGQQSKIGKHI